MITGIFLKLITALMHLIQLMMPNFKVPDIVFTELLQAWDMIVAFNDFIALDDLALCLAIIILFFVAKRLGNWALQFLSMVRGGGRMDI